MDRELMSLHTVKPTISPCAFVTSASSGSGTSCPESARIPTGSPSVTTRQAAAFKNSSGRSAE
jgi:hypothetical protein